MYLNMELMACLQPGHILLYRQYVAQMLGIWSVLYVCIRKNPKSDLHIAGESQIYTALEYLRFM